jgi:hypothetical protein
VQKDFCNKIRGKADITRTALNGLVANNPKPTWLEFGCASGPIYDNCRNAKNSQDHRGHYVGLPNDPNTEDVQWLRPSRFSEKHHSDTSRDHNNPACEIHGSSLNLQETS